jgi:hypothetical protein
LGDLLVGRFDEGAAQLDDGFRKFLARHQLQAATKVLLPGVAHEESFVAAASSRRLFVFAAMRRLEAATTGIFPDQQTSVNLARAAHGPKMQFAFPADFR